MYLMMFHPADPLIVLYDLIAKFQKLARAAGISYMPEKMLDLGITVIKNIYDFEYALMDWQAKILLDKNWINFKSRFTLP